MYCLPSRPHEVTVQVRPSILSSLVSCLVVVIPLTCQADDSIDYNRDIQPILSNSCFTCHGPDEESRKADLRLDDRTVATASAIVPGKAKSSELIQRVTTDDLDLRMPPVDSRRPRLSNKQIQLLARWIDQGATYQQHWAYVPPQRPALPDLPQQLRTRAGNPVDRFVLARLLREGVEPAETAEPRTLVRRLAFDLTGLPPSPTVLRSYSAQIQSPSAYRALVNHLLSQQAFAERLTAYWLDVVRYADSVGIHGDQLVSMSPYRDYVLPGVPRKHALRSVPQGAACRGFDA